MTKAKLITLILAAAIAMPILSAAQTTASGTLAVKATVASGITMVFNSDASGVALTGSGTNAATLDFGSVSAYGAIAGTITRTLNASSFTVSTPFDVHVDKFNSASSNYTLKAQLASADAVNTWTVGGTAVSSAAQSTITATGAYGADVAYALALTIPFSSSASINNTVNFVATAN